MYDKFFTDVSYRARFRGVVVIVFASQMSDAISSLLLFLLLSTMLPLVLGWVLHTLTCQVKVWNEKADAYEHVT